MNWLQKSCQLELQMRSECTGHHHGQTDCIIIAQIGDQTVGYLEYADFEGETSITDIKVRDDLRRQGIATKMYEFLQSETEFPIRHTMQTPPGASWRQSLPE